MRASQPNAERVPDTMRARVRRSIVRGAVQLRRWAYNVVRFVDLPLSLVALLRPRAPIDRARIEARAQRELRAALSAAETPADSSRAVLEFLRSRPPPIGAEVNRLYRPGHSVGEGKASP
jgi:hypothetical protein